MAHNPMYLDKTIRRVVPTLPRLTYNPLFKMLVDSFDFIPRLIWKELKGIPPNHMRLRIGAGNRIFANQLAYMLWPRNFWLHAFHSGLCRLDSTIVDIGCGCGRYSQVLRDYRYRTDRFSGRYVGVDVDEEMLAWCKKNYDADRFSFHCSTHASTVYGSHQRVEHRELYRLPLGDATADFVFSTSLLTHILEHEVRNYFNESCRILKADAYMLMSFFSIDQPPPTYGNRHRFPYRQGHAYIESVEVPEAAVAYKETFLVSIAREAGFRSVDVLALPDDPQPALLCRK